MRPDFTHLRTEYALTPSQARRGGIVVLLLSVFTGAVSAFLLAMVLEVPIPARWLPAGIRFDGPPRTGPIWSKLMSGLGLAVMAIQLSSIAGLLQGLWMTVLGRRNWMLLRMMLVLVALIIAAGAVASVFLGRRIGQVGQ